MRIGSLVVCVNDVFTSSDGYFDKLRDLGIVFPVRDVIYTVREIDVDGTDIGIRLEEIVNMRLNFLDADNWEQSFRMDRFRELDAPHEIKLENILEKESYGN